MSGISSGIGGGGGGGGVDGTHIRPSQITIEDSTPTLTWDDQAGNTWTMDLSSGTIKLDDGGGNLMRHDGTWDFTDGFKQATIARGVGLDLDETMSAIVCDPIPVVSSDDTIAGGEGCVPVDSSGGVVTITLPASPQDGTMLTIYDDGGSAGTNTITIAPNTGHSIAGASTITTNNGIRRYMFGGGVWREI